MHDYELTLIFSPEITEETFPEVIEKVSQFILQKGGVINDVNRWNRRRLAYPIKNFVEANYVLAQFKLPHHLTRELEVNLRGSEEILRYLLVRLEE